MIDPRPKPGQLPYQKFLSDKANIDEIVRLRELKSQFLQTKGAIKYKELLQQLERYPQRADCDFGGDSIRVGFAKDISSEDREVLRRGLQVIKPWRKGPFSIYGIEIDAEWQSHKKWNRIAEHLPDLTGQTIADFGCNNGYYMFKMEHSNPRAVIGFDPSMHYYYSFQAINRLAGRDSIFMEMLGVQDADHYIDCFDTAFLMGVLYHRASPVDCLRSVWRCLRPGGTLILETQGIDHAEPFALFPFKRYAKVPGTYFVPSPSCLYNIVCKSGFKNVEVFDQHRMSSDEQRRTEWMDFESYDDFLDPADPSRTVEGYPAPIRIYLRATKPIGQNMTVR